MTTQESAPGLLLRPLQAEDLPAAAALSASAFGRDISEQAAARRMRQRVAHPLVSDPQGCFVAVQDGSPVGVVEAVLREQLWCLSLLVVSPQAQSTGAGHQLFERALAYGECDGATAGLIPSSSDPRALRLYARAGFSLRPTLDADGTIDRSRLPRADAGVREGAAADMEALAVISREVRGASHTPELQFALSEGAQLLRHGNRGFAAAAPGSGVWLLVARDDQAAAALLYAALDIVGDSDRPPVRWMTAGQDWAIDVVLRLGLQLVPHGALCVRGSPGPLRSFLPSGLSA